MPSRRTVISTLTAAAGTLILPFRAGATGPDGDVFETPMGDVIVYPLNHASMVIDTPLGAIFVDPVDTNAATYDGLPEPDLILVTHEHGDHYNAEALAGQRSSRPPLITNPAVFAMLDDTSDTRALANGEVTTWESHFGDATISAIPAYNTTEGRLNFHPQGRDNGYVVDLGGFRIYISGDTEDIPEMRGLEGIDLAFVCMNLPFTMDVAAAADAVREFGPRFVYPYHYRGRDNGTQDPQEFADLVGDGAEVRMGPWYG